MDDFTVGNKINEYDLPYMVITLTFYTGDEPSFYSKADRRIDQVKLYYIPDYTFTLDNFDKTCKNTIGPVVYIENNFEASTINGDNCNSGSSVLSPNIWIDLTLDDPSTNKIDESGGVISGPHSTPFPSLFAVGAAPTNSTVDNSVQDTKKKGGGSTINAPPTIGLDDKGKRKVWDGLTINGFTSNADYYNTHYPMQNTTIGIKNNVTAIFYENSGPYHIEAIQFALVKEVGTPLSEAELLIEIWMDYFRNDVENPKIKEIKIFDKNNLLSNFDATPGLADCNPTDNINATACLSLDISWVFEKSPNDKVILLNGFDYKKATFNYYFNDGWMVIDDNPVPVPVIESDTVKECVIKKVVKRTNSCQFLPLIEYEKNRAAEILFN